MPFHLFVLFLFFKIHIQLVQGRSYYNKLNGRNKLFLNMGIPIELGVEVEGNPPRGLVDTGTRSSPEEKNYPPLLSLLWGSMGRIFTFDL